MDKRMYHYATPLVALEELKAKGYTIDFNLHDEEILADSSCYVIEHVYRYEGASDPDDEATVYGIRGKNGELGVYLVGDLSQPGKRASAILAQMVFDRQK